MLIGAGVLMPVRVAVFEVATCDAATMPWGKKSKLSGVVSQAWVETEKFFVIPPAMVAVMLVVCPQPAGAARRTHSDWLLLSVEAPLAKVPLQLTENSPVLTEIDAPLAMPVIRIEFDVCSEAGSASACGANCVRSAAPRSRVPKPP